MTFSTVFWACLAAIVVARAAKVAALFVLGIFAAIYDSRSTGD